MSCTPTFSKFLVNMTMTKDSILHLKDFGSWYTFYSYRVTMSATSQYTLGFDLPLVYEKIMLDTYRDYRYISGYPNKNLNIIRDIFYKYEVTKTPEKILNMIHQLHMASLYKSCLHLFNTIEIS